MAAFNEVCTRTSALARLHTITLAVHPDALTADWARHVAVLLSASPLTVFQLYATTTATRGTALPVKALCEQVITAHAHRLTRVALHRVPVAFDTISDVCRRCTELQQLFVPARSGELVRIFHLASRRQT